MMAQVGELAMNMLAFVTPRERYISALMPLCAP